MSDDILPEHVIRIEIWYCMNCKSYLDEPKCPKCSASVNPPPLGVCVSDTAGASGKVG